MSEETVVTDRPLKVDKDLPKNQDYKLEKYWDSRFQKEEKYEWLASYAELKDIIAQHVKKTDKILLVGCGNSQVGPQMIEDGFTELISSDFSQIVINCMKERYPTYQWVVSNIKDLKEFADGEFDIVFDKATMDALVVDEGSVWNPNPNTVKDCKEMCESSFRVLKKNGKFLQLSFQDPFFRKKYLLSNSLEWKQTHYHKVESGLGYHFFVLQKE